MSQLSISGAISGLDTSSLINQLVSVQANQQTLLRTQQSTQQQAADALGRLATGLSSVGSLADALAKTSSWAASTVTSSSGSVTASATGTASGRLTFDVTALATSHALVSATAVASLGTVVASGPLTFTGSDGTSTSIDVGSGSLSDVVSAINTANKGVVANAVQTAPGQYRLQVAATTTGASSAFQLTGLDDPAGTNVLTQGADASITIGSDPATAYTVTSSTNTFSGVLPGVSFTVGKVETGVTLQAAVDGSGVASQVGKLVDAVNAVLSQIDSATSYDTTKKTGGPLVGDSTARSLQQQLLGLVSGTGAPGVRVTRDGTVTFDSAAFQTAFKADPAKVAASFGATATFGAAAGVTGAVRYSSATKQTRAGTYAVAVTRLAAAETWSVAAPAQGQVLTATRGSTTASYTVQAGDSAATIAAGLTAAAAAAKLGVTAVDDGQGGLTLTADVPGSAQAFSASVDGTDGTQVTAGQDAQGSIDGQTATGVGNLLTLGNVTSGAAYLSLDTSGLSQADVDATSGAVGTVTYTPGLAQRLSSLVDTQTRTSTGVLSTAKQGRLSSVKRFQDQIDAWDQRLTAYRAQLTQQFTAMETALAQLKTQTSAISGLSTSLLPSSSS